MEADGIPADGEDEKESLACGYGQLRRPLTYDSIIICGEKRK